MKDRHEATVALSIRVDGTLSSTVSSSGCSIFKVPKPLRQTNAEAYSPDMISIGPYHHGEDHLKGMEVHKMHCVKRFLQRREEISVQRYVMALKGMEEEIRKCYAEPLDHIDGDALVEMMLLDGCFIIELIRGYLSPVGELGEKRVNFHYITLASVKRDLLLVENQLPFFVLSELFHMTLVHNQENDFIHKVLHFFFGMMPGQGYQHNSLIFSDQNIKNLLDLVHDSWLPSPEVRDNYSTRARFGNRDFMVYNATYLRERGIKFEQMYMNEEKSMFDIKFENGVLWIPTIKMEENTDVVLHNLIAHEQCHNSYPMYFTDYVTFMACLINNEEDVKMLGCFPIIANGLGDGEVIVTIFNKLCHQIELSDRSIYWMISDHLMRHCHLVLTEWKAYHWNVWMQIFWQKYFDSPWALIKFLAAVVLLILAALQTIYSLLSYY